MMTNGDRLREVLGCAWGETVYEAAERVVRERDAALGAAKSEMARWAMEAHGKAVAEAHAKSALATRTLFDFSAMQWRDYHE